MNIDSKKEAEKKQIEYMRKIGMTFIVASEKDDIENGTDGYIEEDHIQYPTSLRARLTVEWDSRQEIGLSVYSGSDWKTGKLLSDFAKAGDKLRVHTFYSGRTVVIRFPNQKILNDLLEEAKNEPRQPRFKAREDLNGNWQWVLYIPLKYWKDSLVELGTIEGWPDWCKKFKQ